MSDSVNCSSTGGGTPPTMSYGAPTSVFDGATSQASTVALPIEGNTQQVNGPDPINISPKASPEPQCVAARQSAAMTSLAGLDDVSLNYREGSSLPKKAAMGRRKGNAGNARPRLPGQGPGWVASPVGVPPQAHGDMGMLMPPPLPPGGIFACPPPMPPMTSHMMPPVAPPPPPPPPPTSMHFPIVPTTSTFMQCANVAINGVEEANRRRELRLMKNREAARECRRKKKEYIKYLETRVTLLEGQNKILMGEFAALRDYLNESKQMECNFFANIQALLPPPLAPADAKAFMGMPRNDDQLQ